MAAPVIPNPETQKTPLSGYILAVVSSFGTGLATVIGKWNLMAVSALTMNCFIFSTATVALGLFWLPFKKLSDVFCHSAKAWLWIFLFTITSFIAIWLLWAGVQKMDPSLAAFVNRVEVPIVILLGVIFLGERFGRVEMLGAVLSLIGIVIMKLTLRFEYTTGFWYVLISAVFFGLTEFVSKIAFRYVDAVPLAFIRNILMAIGYWVIFYFGPYTFEGLDKVWYGVLALGLVGPILARLLYMLALKRMELSKLAIISQLHPVFVILIALTFLSQLPTAREVTGGLFLVIGCVVMIWGRRHRRKSSPRAAAGSEQPTPSQR